MSQAEILKGCLRYTMRPVEYPSVQVKAMVGFSMEGYIMNMQTVISCALVMWGAYGLAQAPAPTALAAAVPPELRVMCTWTLPVSPEGVSVIVDRVCDLNFNAIAWTSGREDEDLVRICRAKGVRTFKVLEPLHKREGAVFQVMEPGEDALPGAVKPAADHPYQYGGEPAPGCREVLDQALVCPHDPGVIAYTMGLVAKAQAAGYDGVCWDFIGYRNYRSCACALCRTELAAFRAAHPDLAPEAAAQSFYKAGLVDLYAALYKETRAAAPAMQVMCHIHPVYLPDPLYGREVRVDYCGMTAAWFFKPHWELAKVEQYLAATVNGPYADPATVGMPMIGFYNDDGSRRSAARVREELALVVKTHARALMVAELGNILQDPEIAAAYRDAAAPVPPVGAPIKANP
jgi:hypothetical protein